MFHGKSYWLHQPAARLSAIARINIYMLTPETLRAVIGVTISLYKCPAISAGKIFNVTLKFFVHGLVPISLSLLRRSKVRFRLGDAVAARSKFQ